MEINNNILEEKAALIFTQDNLPAIMYFLNQCKNIPTRFTGDNEFETIVNAIKFDSKEEFIKTVISKIN